MKAKLARLVWLLALLAAAAGCTTRTNLIYHDPNFPPPSFADRKLVLGGIAWAAEETVLPPDDEATATALLADMLRRRLASEFGETSVEPAGYLAARMGGLTCRSLTLHLRHNPELGQAEKDRLAAALGDSCGYVIFGRVVKEEVKDEGDEETWRLRRWLHIDFQVYDPSRARLVWRNEIGGSAERRGAVEEELPFFEQLFSGLVGAAVDRLLGLKENPYGPPPLADVAAVTYRVLVQELRKR